MEVSGSKKKRPSGAEDTDAVPEKRQKLSEDASATRDVSESESQTITEDNGTAVKGNQTGDSNVKEAMLKNLRPQNVLEIKKSPKANEEGDGGNEKKKPYHRRMKHTLNCVLQQMEFYFGDSSLSKDRFLKSMVDSSPDGYVDLSIFGNFNKLQTLHKDGISRNVLIQALSRSTMLQLNEDKTKVRRVTPYQEICQEETDKRTIYVEYLPSHATHMWVKQIFSQCGKVAYVSLPTYKTSKQIKGFAFVEFEKPEEAERACAMLNNPLPDKVLERPGKFPKTNKTLDRLQKLAPNCPVPVNNEENDPTQEKQEEDPKSSDAEAKKKKKKKAKKRKPQDSSTEDGAAQAGSSASEQKPDGKKKKKKRKRKLSQCQEPNAGEDGGVSESVGEVRENNRDQGYEGKEHADDPSQMAVKKVKEAGEDTSVSKEKSEETLIADSSLQAKKRKKKKKRSKADGTGSSEELGSQQVKDQRSEKLNEAIDLAAQHKASAVDSSHQPERKLSHKERKLLRQEDIRRKKLQKLQGVESEHKEGQTDITKNDTDSNSCENINKELDGNQPTSILKLKKAAEKKRVEFDPVPITTEFVEAKGARKRKKLKREKPHLRVISKREWLSLKGEYIDQQKSHMKALKESLRELKQQENKESGRPWPRQAVDLEDVFGTKPLKLSHEVRMAHVEKMKFTPNVIVQWWCSHEMHRDKIRTMFKETHASSIAYIDANEEAKSGYIRFKNEASAEEFAKMSRTSASFMARVLPVDQQEEYWEKANADRMKKLGGRKKEQGCDRIARKVFQRNKATFFNKPSRIVFDDAEEDDDASNKCEQQEAEDKGSPAKSPTK